MGRTSGNMERENVNGPPFPVVHWHDMGTWKSFRLGSPGDDVAFCLTHQPSCYRRGPYKLLIEVCSGENHHKWGCFDEQDQPVRYFHSEQNAKGEAEAIARVLWKDRWK